MSVLLQLAQHIWPCACAGWNSVGVAVCWCRSFSGAFHCPPAREFCQFETITGIRHAEFHAWQLYIVVAIFIGLPVMLFL